MQIHKEFGYDVETGEQINELLSVSKKSKYGEIFLEKKIDSTITEQYTKFESKENLLLLPETILKEINISDKEYWHQLFFISIDSNENYNSLYTIMHLPELFPDTPFFIKHKTKIDTTILSILPHAITRMDLNENEIYVDYAQHCLKYEGNNFVERLISNLDTYLETTISSGASSNFRAIINSCEKNKLLSIHLYLKRNKYILYTSFSEKEETNYFDH